MSKPGPASTLRNEAYLAGLELLGPDDDVEGWNALTTYEAVRGTLFHTRPVLVKYSVRLQVSIALTFMSDYSEVCTRDSSE